MRAFDLSGADRQIIGQGFAIVQLISATYQIAMAPAHGSLVVVHFRSFEMTSECLQRLVEAPGFERVLLRVHPGLLRGGLGRNRFRGVAQILANMIEINQVAALGAKLLLHLAHDPWRSVPDRMNRGNSRRSRPEPRIREAVVPRFRRRPRSRPRKPALCSLWRAPGKSWPLATTASCLCACPSGWRPALQWGPCRHPFER